jgi:hypothetical protein
MEGDAIGPGGCTDIDGCAGDPCFIDSELNVTVLCSDVPAPGIPPFTCGPCPTVRSSRSGVLLLTP